MSQKRLLSGSLSLLLSTSLLAQQPQAPPPATSPQAQQTQPAPPPATSPQAQQTQQTPQPPPPATSPQAQQTRQTTPAPPPPATSPQAQQTGQTAPGNQAPNLPPSTPPASNTTTNAPMQGAQAPQTPAPAATVTFSGLNLQNASLPEVIDLLARSLKINYILDPRVRGGVTLNTYGEVRQIDQRALLDTILRINNAAMVQVGDIYRIVPINDAARLPMEPQVDRKTVPSDDQVMLNLVFLKYASADELLNVLKPFIGEGATMYSYPPANLLFILDSNRNMRRTMQLISLFDDQTLASQRIRAFELKNSRPSEFIKELEQVFKSISLSDKGAPIRFLALDRINTVIAVVTNPAAFTEVERWVERLDVPVKITAGTVDNYVYRVKYGRAESLAGAIMQLYGMPMPGAYGGGYGGSTSPFGGMGGYGMGGYGGGGAYGMMGGSPYGGAYGNFTPPYASAGAPIAAVGEPSAATTAGGTGTAAATGAAAGAAAGTAAVAGANLTGSYMGAMMGGFMAGMPRVIPRIEDNSILIQASPQQYASITKLLDELDVSPRQVLIEAKIYEVSLTGAFSSGVSAYLQKRGTSSSGSSATGAKLDTFQPLGSLAGGALNLSAGFLVGQSRELLAFLQTQESTERAKVVSAPSIIATDSIGASLNVGTEVPTLTAQAVTGVQSGGNSLFANSISSRNTGVTLNIRARVTPSGIVTMEIAQEVSAPIAPAAGSIQSPSFSKRSVQTQITVQDGDTVAIGGIITDSSSSSTLGIPLLTRIPIVGGVFGSKSVSRERTELIIFLTPKVIYDTNAIQEASDELKNNLRRLRKVIKQ